MAKVPEKSTCCAFCDGHSTTPIMDFGEVALAGGFLKQEDFAGERFYPLKLFFCNDCYMVQLADHVDQDVLFRNYFYFSSAIRTLRDHFKDYAAEVVSKFLEPECSTVVEIGCNDGVLLKPMADQGVRTVIGVDPAENIVSTIDDQRITIFNDLFGDTVAGQIVERHGKADMVVANNVFAHISDIQAVTRAISNVLTDDGVFVFEVHYLGQIIHGLQYDMIYHEHIYYYSLIGLMNHFARFDMEIFDIKEIPIHGGSMRYYVRKKGAAKHGPVTSFVTQLQSQEIADRFDKPETYARFASDVAQRKERLMELLDRLRAQGSTIVGYGASGRANTIIQYSGIDHRHMDYMIDDSDAKWGYYTPGSHFLIRSADGMKENPPDYLLIFAWSFIDEIAEKRRSYLDQGGQMIVPLPDVRVSAGPNGDGAK